MAFKAVPIAASQITGTLTNFPVLVKPSAMTGWASLSSAEAQSSRWYSDLAKTTELPREVVSADEIYILVPSAANGTTIYCEYDGVASDYAAGDTYGRNAVWADYLAVYHMSAVTDATGGGNDLVATGSPTLITGAFGHANAAYDYPGNISNYHKTASAMIANADTNDWTIQAWTIPDVSTRGDFLGVWPELQLKWDHASYADDFSFWSIYGTTNVSAASAANYSQDVWRMVHATLDYSARAGEIFVNGASAGTSTGSGTRVAGDYELSVGVEWAGGAYNPYNGGVDEIRLRQGVLADEWIAAEYNNQGAVGTFWGTVEDAGGSPSSSPSVSVSSSPSTSVSSSPSTSVSDSPSSSPSTSVSSSPSTSISDSPSSSVSSSPSPSSSVSSSPSSSPSGSSSPSSSPSTSVSDSPSSSPSSSASPSSSPSSSSSSSVSSSPSVSVSSSVSDSPSTSVSSSPSTSVSSSVSSSPSAALTDATTHYRIRRYNSGSTTWEYVS